MSHELEINEEGKARMFYAGQAPWHGLGKSVEREVTAAEAIKLAGLDWTVGSRPLWRGTNDETNHFEKVDTFKAIVRNMDEKFYGVVGEGYKIIQNEEAFQLLDVLVGEGLAMFHTAGSMFGGRKIFITCKLPDSIHIGPDQVDKYLTLCTGHDGSLSLHIKWTAIRTVCWNTCSAAFNIRGGKVAAQDTITIKHTENWKSRVSEVREALNLTNLYYSRLDECFNQLIETPMDDAEYVSFSKEMYPDVEREGLKPIDRTKTRRAIANLFWYGVGQEHPDVKNTRWAAYNSISEYIDHERTYGSSKSGTVLDSRMNSIIWGQGAAVKKRALDLLSV